jgi:hypothetical protein
MDWLIRPGLAVDGWIGQGLANWSRIVLELADWQIREIFASDWLFKVWPESSSVETSSRSL